MAELILSINFNPLKKYRNIKLSFHITFLEQGLGALLRELFVIGAESESVMLRWAIRILSVHKDVQKKVQQEIDLVVGKERCVEWSDLEK